MRVTSTQASRMTQQIDLNSFTLYNFDSNTNFQRQGQTSESESWVLLSDHGRSVDPPSSQLSGSHMSPTVRSVVIGYPGSGKTSLVNNLCGTDFKSGIAQGRMTTEMESGRCKYIIEAKFEIWDAPALDRNDKNKTNSSEIRKILRTEKWDVIYIVVKMDPRFEDVTLTQLQQISEQVKNECISCCEIVYMISFSDQVPAEVKNSFNDNLGQSIKALGISEKLILFSNVGTHFQNVAKILYHQATNRSSHEIIKLKQISSVTDNSDDFENIEIKPKEDEKDNRKFSLLEWFKSIFCFKIILMVIASFIARRLIMKKQIQ